MSKNNNGGPTKGDLQFMQLFGRENISGPSIGINYAARGISPYREALGKYDTGLSPALYESGYERNPVLAQQYLRASNQSGGKQLWNGFWSRTASIAPKVGQGIGHVLGFGSSVLKGGINSWDPSDWKVEDMYDNAIVKAFQDLDEGIKETIPVYQSKAYTEGNWTQKMFTTSFWATDGFDGLAFLASAYVPGAAIGKLGKISTALRGIEKSKRALNFAKQLEKVTDFTGVDSKLAVSTLYNTVSEAGFEAAEVNAVMREEFAKQMGFASYEEAQKDPEADAIIRDKAGASAARTFAWNSAALLAPNFFQSKWLHGSPQSHSRELQLRLRRDPNLAKATTKSTADYLGGFAKGVASEGLWEENIQTSVTAYEERFAKGYQDEGAVIGPLTNLLKNGWSFAKTVGTLGIMGPDAGTMEDDAGSAILLGALMGGGMSIASTYMEGKQEKDFLAAESKAWKDLQSYNEAAKNILVQDFKSPYTPIKITTDENGKEIVSYTDSSNPNGKLDSDKMTALAYNHGLQSLLYGEAMLAEQNSSDMHREFNKNMALAAYAWRLATSTVNAQNAKDLIELDNTLNEEYAMDEFGEDNIVAENKQKLSEMVDMFYQARSEVRGPEKISDNKFDQAFDTMMIRNAFYLKRKREAVESMQTTTEKQAKEKQALLDEIDARYKDLQTKRKALKKDFMRQVDPLSSLNEKRDSLKKKLDKGEITQTQYNKEFNALDYIADEATKIYGTENLNYDMNSGLNITEFATMGNQSIHNRENVREPRNPIERLLYNVGTTALVEEEIQRNALSATDDMASSTEFVKSLNRANQLTPNIEQAVEQVQNQYKTKVQQAESQREEVESFEFDDNPTTDEDAAFLLQGDTPDTLNPMLEEYARNLGMEQSLIDSAMARPLAFYNELALAQEQQIQALNNQIQQLNTQASEVNDAYGSLVQKAEETSQSEDLLQMAQQAYTEGRKDEAHMRLIDYNLGQTLEKVNKMVQDFERAPDQFLKEDEVDFLISTLVKARDAFELRTDITDETFRQYSIERINEALGQLGVLLDHIKENKNNRFAKQLFTVAQSVAELQDILRLDSEGVPTTSSPLYQILTDAFGNHQRITEVFKAARKADGSISSKAVNTIIQYASTKAEANSRLSAIKNLEKWQLEYIQELKAVRPKAWVANIAAIAKNPNKYGPYMIQVGMDMYEEFQDASTPFYRYSKHKDLATLRFELSKQKSEDGAYAGMDVETSAQLDKVIEALSKLAGAGKALSMIQAEFDVFKALEEEISISEELAKGDVKIAPTAQQFTAVQQLLSYVQSKFTKGPFGKVSVLQGVLGAGKSLVGMKYVVRILKKLMNLSDANIVAFGHNAYSSEVIASSVYDDPNNGGTMEDFLNRTDISQVKLVILDEAMAMTNAEIETVYRKIEDENETRSTPEDKIKIIALGDSSQITVEDVENTALGSLANYATKDSSSLSVVYRTNVNSIIDVINTFKDRPDPLVSINSTASHTLADLKSMATTNEAFGVQGGSLEDLVSLVNKPSDKSRVIIVNNETSAKRVRDQLSNDNVDVVVYFDAQSRQWDQVYIYMDQGMNKFDGTPFKSTLEYNAAMYTMVGRAKQFVFLANPSLTVNTPIVDAQIASKVEDNTEEFERNSSLYNDELEATQAVLEAIDSSRAKSLERTPKEKLEEDDTLRETMPEQREVEHDELIDDDLTNDEKDHEDVPTESELENEDEEKLTPPEQVLQQVPVGENNTVPFRHSFANPTNALTYPTSMKDTSQDIDPTKPASLIVDTSGTVHLVQEKAGRYYHIAIIGDNELKEAGFDNMRTLIEGSEKIQSSAIDTSSRGFEVPEDVNPVIGTVNFERVHGLRYQLENFLNNSTNTLRDVISKWYDGFFNEAAGGRGVLPDTDFFNEDGSINWGSNKFMVQIFNDRQIKEMRGRGASYNAKFLPKKGIPYLIIKNPSTKSSTSNDPTAIDQFIRLEPKRLTSDNKWVNTLSGYASLAETLKEYGLNIGTPTFTKVMKLWRNRLQAIEGTSNVEINSDVSAFDLLTEVEELAPVMQNLSEDDITTLVQLLDQMATKYLYGTKKGALRFTEAEAKELVKNNPESYHSIEATKNLGDKTSTAKVWVVYIKDSDGSRAGVLTGNNISTTTGPAQVALNILSNANQKMGDIRVRVTSASAARSYTKSLMSGSEANSQYYKWKQSTLKQFVDDLFTNYPEMLSDVSKAELTGANEDGAISTSKMEDILTAFMQNVVNEEGFPVELRDEINQMWSGFIDNKEKMREELSTKPVTLDALKNMLSNVDKMRTPLNRQYFNKIGRELNKDSSRAEVNNLLTDFFKGVMPTTIQGIVIPNGTKVSDLPEQEVKKPIPKETKKKAEENIKEVAKRDTQHLERADSLAFKRLKDIAEGRFVEETEQEERQHLQMLAKFIRKTIRTSDFAIWKADPKSQWAKKFSGDFGNVASKFLFNKELNTDMFEGALHHMIINAQTFDTESDNAWLHELLHLVTVPAFNKVMNPDKYGTPTQRDKDFVEEIELLTTEFNKRLKKSGKNLKDIYWPTQSELNGREFIANLSNPTFIKEAKKRKFGGSTILGKALEAIVRWLGLSTDNDSQIDFFEATVASLEKYYGIKMLEQAHTSAPVVVKTSEEAVPEQVLNIEKRRQKALNPKGPVDENNDLINWYFFLSSNFKGNPGAGARLIINFGTTGDLEFSNVPAAVPVNNRYPTITDTKTWRLSNNEVSLSLDDIKQYANSVSYKREDGKITEFWNRGEINAKYDLELQRLKKGPEQTVERPELLEAINNLFKEDAQIQEYMKKFDRTKLTPTELLSLNNRLESLREDIEDNDVDIDDVLDELSGFFDEEISRADQLSRASKESDVKFKGIHKLTDAPSLVNKAARTEFTEQFLGLTPVIAQKAGIRPDKGRWVDMIYEMLRNSITSPELGVMKKVVKLASRASTARRLEDETGGAIGQREPILKALVNFIWSEGLQRTSEDTMYPSRNSLMTALQASFPEEFNFATTSDYTRALTEAMLEKDDNKKYTNISEVRKFVKNTNSLINALSYKEQDPQEGQKPLSVAEHVTNLMDKSRLYIPHSADAITKDTKSVKFVLNNFESAASYMMARSWVMDTMSRLLDEATKPVRGRLVKSRQELLYEIQQRLSADTNTVSRKENKRGEDLLKEGALKALQKSWGNKPLLFYMLKTIYPDWDVVKMEEVEELIELSEEFANRNESLYGIRKETEDSDLVDQESRLTDSVKEVLSFIKNPTYETLGIWHPKRFLSNRHTFVAMMNFIFEHVDLNALDQWNKQKKYLDRMHRSTFSDIEDKLYTTLNDLQQQANFKINEVVGKHLALEIEKDSLSTTRMSIIYDPQGNLMKEDGSQLTLAEAQEKLSRQKAAGIKKEERVEIVSRNMLPQEAFAIMQNLSPQMSERMFNNMYLKSKSANTLRELANTFGSLTEKNYKIAQHENDFGNISTSYFNASGFGLDKSIYGSIRHVLEVYHDNKGLEGNFKLEAEIKDIYQLAKDRSKEAIPAFLKFFKMADAADTLDIKRINSDNIYSKIIAFIDEANQVKKSDDLSKLFKKESSIFKELRKVLRYAEDQLRKKSVSDSKNNKLYTSVPKSWFYTVMHHFTKASRTKNNQGATGSNSFFGSRLMEFMKTPFYKQSPFIKGIQRIYSVSEHDATKNTLTLKTTPFNRETEQFFYTRAFTHGFIDSIASGSATTRTYNQFTYQVADKSRMPMAEMRVLDNDELLEATKGFVRQAIMQPDAFIKARQKAHTEGRHLNFTVLDEVLEYANVELDIKHVDYISEEILNRLQRQGREFAKDFANSRAFVSSNIAVALEKLVDGDNNANYRGLKEARENLGLISTINPNKRTQEDNDNLAKAISPLAELFYMNNYLNGYGLNQMLSGPFNYYKHTEDVVKRMSGVVGPGIYPLVNPDFGAAEKFRVLVAEDRESKEETLKNLIDTLVEDENEKNQLSTFFELFESTDGQGFMTPARHADLQKGYGKAYNLGNVMKPMHFEIITENVVVDRLPNPNMQPGQYASQLQALEELYGKENLNFSEDPDSEGGFLASVQEPVPVYLKYSSVVLSDDLIERYPALGKIRAYLEDAGAGELVFGSAVKSAKTTSKVKLDTIYNHTAGTIPDVSGSMLELNNENYKMQFNPLAKVDKKVSIFTQLMYFINIMGTNKDSAQKAYSAVSYLMNEYLSTLNEDLATDKQIASKIRESMDNPGNELMRALLEAGIHPSNPTISRKAFTQLASLIENRVQKIKFRGSKLILQSSEGITKGYDNNLTPEQNMQAQGLKFVKMSGGRYAAEVILPKGMLTQEQLRNLESGKDTYLLPDFFGYRIPSTEIHSAVPMKVVGTYDDKGTNVVIAPQELVYLHGSDFDVDSLFVIQRETMNPSDARILGLESDTPVGYVRDAKTGTWKFDYNNDVLREYLDKLDNRISVLERIRVSKELSTSVNRLAVIEAEIKRLERSKGLIKESYTKNMIMDIMLSTITDKKNRARMNTPIVMSLFKDRDNPDSVRSKLEMYGAWPEDESRDLSKIQNSYISLKSMKDGAVLTGAFANAIKVFSYMYTAGPDGSRAKVVPELALDYDGFTYDQIEDKSFDGNLTWQYLDAAVNLAIDNLNEMILPKLGVNVTTGGAWSTMIALGMDVTSATLLVKNPLIQKLGSVEYNNVDTALPQLAKETLEDAYTKAFGEEGWNSLLETSKKGSEGVEIEGILDRLYRDLDSLFTGDNTFDDVKLNDDILSYIIHDDMEMLEHEAGKFDFEGATTPLKVALLKFKALHLYAKAHKLGEQARTLSDVLNVIRVNPGTPEKMDKFNQAFDKIFNVGEDTNLTQVDDTQNKTPMEYSPEQMKLEVKPTFGFHIPELLNNAPHISKAITAAKITQDKISEVLFKFRTPTVNFAKEVLKDLDFIGFGLNRLEYTDILNELEHMLIASLYNDKIKSENVYQRSASSKLTNIAAFNHRLVDRLNALKTADENAYNESKNNGDGHYTRNKFLNSLVIEKRGYTVSIRMANVISPDMGEVALLREDFKRLAEFEEIVNPSTGVSTFKYNPGIVNESNSVQEDLLAFSVINSGFKFSATSYSAFVDPNLYTDIDDRFVELFKKFSEDENLRAKMKPWFKIALAFKKADSLGRLPKTKIGEQGSKEAHAVVIQGPAKAGTNGSYRGKELVHLSDGTIQEVFFDRKYINKAKGQSNSKVTEEYPEYAVSVNYPDAEDQFGKTTYDVYQRITPQQILKEADHIYYQRLGRKSSTGYYVNTDTLDIKQPFNPIYRTLTVADVTNPTVLSYDQIEAGETIRLTTYDDAMRVGSVLATVKEVKEAVSAIEGMKRYAYTVEYSEAPTENVSRSSSVVNPYTVEDFLRDVTNTTNNLNCK